MILETIASPKDIKKLNYKQLGQLCSEIRACLITTVSKTGGHLASNLGTVELTVALHKVFSSPTDQIVWDVGHQSYTHKLLTGRRQQFDTLRQEGGLSGFPKQSESVHDAFIAGHSGNSISAGLGLLTGKDLKGEKGSVVAVIGDGSFTNGMAYEGLNNAGRSNQRMIIVLNDNEMSISQNVGALAKYLAKIRSTTSYFKLKDFTQDTLLKIPVVGEGVVDMVSSSKKAVKQMLYHSNLFEDFGYVYLGPVDGHNLESLCEVFTRAKELRRPVVVHVETKKGKGYKHAERNPSKYHGVSTFDIATGTMKSSKEKSFSQVFGDKLTQLARQDSKICAVTAAMQHGTGLSPFYQEFGHKGRYFDVGIAESHGITFSAGLAAKGLLPVFAVYSTFLQRGYDQVLHDCSIESKHLVLAVDRAGIVGDDGETHQGLFDVAFLSTIPGISIYSPATLAELELCLEQALYQEKGVVAVRYPRGGEPSLPERWKEPSAFYSYYPGEAKDTLLITYGRIFGEVCKAVSLLKESGKEVSLLKLTKVHPIDEKLLKIAMEYSGVYFVEEGIKNGSVAQQFGSLLLENGFQGSYTIRAVDNCFVPQATVQRAFAHLGFDAGSIKKMVVGE